MNDKLWKVTFKRKEFHQFITADNIKQVIDCFDCDIDLFTCIELIASMGDIESGNLVR